MTEIDPTGSFSVVSFPPERNATLDTIRWAKKRLHVPVLLEIDVTTVRESIRAYRRRTGKGLSLTAWVVSCVTRAAAEHPRVHAVRKGRRSLVLFDEVDVTVLVERDVGEPEEGQTLAMPTVIRRAHGRHPTEIHDEIRRAKSREVPAGSASFQGKAPLWLQSLFFRLPWWLRDLLFWRWFLRSPERIKRTMGTVAVTSVGMAAPGVLSWGVPLSIHPLTVAVGGISRRQLEGDKRRVLGLTILFDHEVVDGAPVGRFVHRLGKLVTEVEGLSDDDEQVKG